MSPSFNTLLFGALAVANIAHSAPSPPKTKQFSVEQVKNPSFTRNGPLALARAYSKYTAKVPADLQHLVTRLVSQGHHSRDTASAEAIPQKHDNEYLTPVQIGSPPQTLSLDLDTGSADLWVFSTETENKFVNGQTLYSPDKSDTSKEVTGSVWDISYGDGSSSRGNVFTDDVTLGGLTVKKQAVEVAKNVSSSFTSKPDMDGILGLAFSKLNTVKPIPQKTFFENALSDLDEPVFTADLMPGAPGKYNFGFIDKSAYEGDIAYTDIDKSKGYWTFTATGFAIGSENTTLGDTPITGIADTGTTLLLLPSAINKVYYEKVPNAELNSSLGGYTFPCNTTLPDFIFGVGKDSSTSTSTSTKYTIPGELMRYAPIAQGSPTCFGGLQSSDRIGTNVFGDVALKAGFVVFDAGKSRLGWAKKA